MELKGWTILAAVAASVGALVSLVRWFVDSRDVTLEVGYRDERGEFRQDQISIENGDSLDLEVVNVGGSKARNMTVRVSLPPRISVDRARSGEWREADPSKTMSEEATGWEYDLPVIDGDGREKLPALVVSRDGEMEIVSAQGI